MTICVICFSFCGVEMKFFELEDSMGRFRFAQSCLGLAGCLCVSYAVWTPFWLTNKGLWTTWNEDRSDQTSSKDDVFSGE